MYLSAIAFTSRTALLAVRCTLIWRPLVSRPLTTMMPSRRLSLTTSTLPGNQLLELRVGVAAGRRTPGGRDGLERRRLEEVLAPSSPATAPSMPAGRARMKWSLRTSLA